MRSFLLAAAAAAAAALTAAPAGAASRNLGITSFEKIRVEGPFRITLKTGVPPYARAVGDQAALDRVGVEMRGTTLIIRNSQASSRNGDLGKDPGTVELMLGTHDLHSAWLTGSGTMAIDRVKGLTFDLSVSGSGGARIADAQVDQMTISVMGTASAAVAGKAGKVTVVVRGVSSLDAGGLAAHDALITAEGASTIDAAVSNSVKIDADGPATIRLAGRPSCTLRISGSADVSGCR
jgi:hypothetical protein